MSFWTEDRVELLKRLRREGHSFAVIAREIGCSRSAAIAKADREKLPKVSTTTVRSSRSKVAVASRFSGARSDRVKDARDLEVCDAIDRGWDTPLISHTYGVGSGHVDDLRAVLAKLDA
ncbi:MAG: GcrA family cell cycle regulator [Pseudomonadota bacterium]